MHLATFGASKCQILFPFAAQRPQREEPSGLLSCAVVGVPGGQLPQVGADSGLGEEPPPLCHGLRRRKTISGGGGTFAGVEKTGWVSKRD